MSNSSGGKMTSRSKNTLRSYETEIEKCREESNWKKAVELAQQLKARSQQHESLAHFLIGEGKLEIYLSEWPPIKENQERAQRELSEARGYLTLATDEAGKKAGVALDAHLLLGKLNYACGAYEDTLKNYKMAELSSLTEKELPIRSLKIVAESYAIKGLCLEQTSVPGSSSRFKQAEKESEMINCYELASDLTLLYLQRGNPSTGVGPTLETALQRAPLLHIQAGRLTEAVDRYRNMLMAEESPSTQALRLTLTRLLAEVLMRGVTGQIYKPPADIRRTTSTLSRKKDDGQEGPWKPKKYCRMNQFVPTCIQEELALVLVIGEAMSARSAVLSQSAEFASLRERSLSVASTMADLLAIFAICARQHRLLIECLDRAMKFSFGCAHIWRQRALAYAAHCSITSVHSETTNISTGPATPIVSALAVTKHAGNLCAKDAGLRLLTADLCYKGNWIEEGLELAEEALQIELNECGPLLARCWLFVGIGYQMKAQKSNARIDKVALNEKAQTHLLRSIELDDNDHMSFYHLALNYTYTGQLSEAMDSCRSALQRSPEFARALRLALGVWGALSPAPRALPLAPALLQHCAATCRALLPAQTALTIGVNLLQTLTQMEAEAEADTDVDHLDALSDSQHDDTHSVRDAASIRAESAGVHRLERALSENASTINNNVRKSPFSEQKAMAWLLVAEIYLKLNRVSTAAVCVSEAAALMPFSHQVLYTRGLVYAASLEWEEARQCFQNALSIHPTHINSMVQLGSAYYHLGWLRLAEHWVRSALTLGGGRSSWQLLSMILSALQEPSAAADAAARALKAPADINQV